MSINLNNIHFIIVEPHTPGNIGSIARACKNMGISNIYLVNPVAFTDETFRLGWGAKDVIDAMKIISSLDEILPDMHLVIATTQRGRDQHQPLWTPREVVDHVGKLDPSHQVAFLFGRENNGLTNDELDACNLLSTIPTNTPYPALNLSQAAMVYGYELFQAHATSHHITPYTWQLATQSEQDLLYRKLEDILPNLPVVPRKGTKEFVALFKRVLGRTSLETRDIRLFLKLFDLFKKC